MDVRSLEHQRRASEANIRQVHVCLIHYCLVFLCACVMYTYLGEREGMKMKR